MSILLFAFFRILCYNIHMTIPHKERLVTLCGIAHIKFYEIYCTGGISNVYRCNLSDK